MTNSTIAQTNDTTPNEVIDMNEVNKSALCSTMAAEMFHNGLDPIGSLKVAAAFIGACEYMDDEELFAEFFAEGLEVTEVAFANSNEHEHNLVMADVMHALSQGKYLTEEGGMGTRFKELVGMRKEAYAPIPIDQPIERRFNYVGNKKGAVGKLAIENVHALEATPYTVDSYIMKVALEVTSKNGGFEKDPEAYVLRGCMKMDPEMAYHSEFKKDKRGRDYQAACHGPIGAASDRSRALMDLVGVPTNYDIEEVKTVIMHEMEDMVPNVQEAATERKNVGDVQFVINHLGEKGFKAYSFIKAARIMRELYKGNRPYVGMAAGYDAKCSGPQLGAMLVGDAGVAASCGMTLEELDDAYHNAVACCVQAGMTLMGRNDVKKPFMGIFYGQGWEAFTSRDEEMTDACWEAIHPGGLVTDTNAKRFHKAIKKSFGQKLNTLRTAIRNMAKVSEGRTTHFMSDGFEVAMNYKHKVNALGQELGYTEDGKVEGFDVHVRNNAEEYKFINFALNTKDVHVGDFARNGFVNMIQATDALIARLIIVHLSRLGAKHIISVHDCFRVNVTEMHLLRQAIKNAYMDLFGMTKWAATEDLPMGTDILALYFEGANKQVVVDGEERMITQFTSKGTRYFQKINGVYIKNLICQLGTKGNGESYYFAK